MAKKFLPELITINEAFDTMFDSVQWSQHGSSYVAQCKLDDMDFTLNIEGMNFRTVAGLHTYLNLAFTRIINGQFVETLVNTGENQSRVFGAVINELKKKVQELDREFEIDAIVLIAVTAESKRLQLYKRILSSKVYGLEPWRLRAEVQVKKGTALVGTKEPLPKAVFEALKTELAQRGKALIDS